MPATIERQMLTPPEIAALFGVDVVKVHAWIKSGELLAIDGSAKRGDRPRYLVDRADLEIFKTSRRITPPAPKPTRRKRAASINEGSYY